MKLVLSIVEVKSLQKLFYNIVFQHPVALLLKHHLHKSLHKKT
jgi:hypothetical protein